MPGMSGFELLSVVRRRFPQVQAIAMSGAYMGRRIGGIAADAFYQKGTGIGRLLLIVQAMSRPERQTSRRHPGTPTPIWIAENGQGPFGRRYVTITCPECLRTFPQPTGAAIPVIQKAACTYCSALIRYAVVQPEDTAFGLHVISEIGRRMPTPPIDERPGVESRNGAQLSPLRKPVVPAPAIHATDWGQGE